MGDEELKERGMPPEALVQLRSCVSKQQQAQAQAANGLNCPNRAAPSCAAPSCDSEPAEPVGGLASGGAELRPPRNPSASGEWCALTGGGAQVGGDVRTQWRLPAMDAAMPPHLVPMQPGCYSGQPCYLVPCPGAKAYRKCDQGCRQMRQLGQQMRSVRLDEDRRPCSNGSSASDSSLGSHSPPDTEVLPTPLPPHLWERGESTQR